LKVGSYVDVRTALAACLGDARCGRFLISWWLQVMFQQVIAQ